MSNTISKNLDLLQVEKKGNTMTINNIDKGDTVVLSIEEWHKLNEGCKSGDEMLKRIRQYYEQQSK